MQEIKSIVCVFGVDESIDYCGCCRGGWAPYGDPSKSIKENVQELAARLNDIFGNRVECKFIDVNTGEIKNYPDIEKIIGQVLLPMTVIDGIPRSHGYLDQDIIIDTVKKQLHKTEQ